MGDSIPDAAASGNPSLGADARLITYVLTWVARTLPTAPHRLFDPPVGYPAPSALTGSEHFLSSQLVFAPVYAATRNPVLAVNVAALATYYAGGLTMLALLRWGGLAWPAALLGAIANMLAPLRTPADLHVLQYPSWCLPLVLWAHQRLVAAPTVRRAAGLCGATALSLFASYYMAANVGVLLIILLLWQFMARTDRIRAGLATLAAVLPAVGALLVFSIPYLARLGEPRYPGIPDLSGVADLAPWLWRLLVGQMRFSVLALAAIGVVGGWRLAGHAGACTRLAGMLVLVGAALSLGPSVRWGDMVIPLPFAPIYLSPASRAISPSRFITLAGCGLTVLAAGGVETLMRRWRFRGAQALGVVAFILVGLESVWLFDAFTVSALPTPARMPRICRWLRSRAEGPVLELPSSRLDASGRIMLVQANAMYFSLFHGRPLLNLHTNDRPIATQIVDRTAADLPDEQALQALVDMTRVRWILVHHDALRAREADRIVQTWSHTPGVSLAGRFGSLLVYEVRRAPRFDWYEYLSRPPEAGRTPLGTPLTALDPEAAAAEVTAVDLPSAAFAGLWLTVPLTVTNRGPGGWPAMVPAGAPATYTVQLLARWRSLGDDGGAVPPAQPIPLPYDVPADSSSSVVATVSIPATAGPYELEVGVQQVGAPELRGPRSAPLRLRLTVVPNPARG